MLLDIGGGTTDIAVYSPAAASIHTATIPVGGNILTNDISLGLKTTFAEAEDVKRTYGVRAIGRRERADRSQVASLDGPQRREARSVAAAADRRAARARDASHGAANIVENVPRDLVLGEVVLTGGGALLRGIDAIAAEVFDLPVRVGVRSTIGGLTDAMKQPAYATAIGLVLFGAERRDGEAPRCAPGWRGGTVRASSPALAGEIYGTMKLLFYGGTRRDD